MLEFPGRKSLLLSFVDFPDSLSRIEGHIYVGIPWEEVLAAVKLSSTIVSLFW